jgi:hypothetical protein
MNSRQPIRSCTFTVLLSCILACLASCTLAETAEKPRKLSAGDLTVILQNWDKIYYGGVMIDSGDTLSGGIVVIAGSLDIQDGGVLEGDAWIINGSLILNGTAFVGGDINLVNSQEFLSHAAAVAGDTYYYRCECRLDHELFERDGKLEFEKHEDPRAVKTKLSISPGDVCRVDYNVVKVGLKRRNPRHRKPYVEGHALMHVPFWKETGGFLGFDVDVSVPVKDERLEILLRGFKRTHTNDDWQLSRLENTLIVLLTGDDFHDYFERRGGELGLRFHAREHIRMETVLSFQRDVSLDERKMRSLLVSESKLKQNPPIDEGDRLAVSVKLEYDTRGETVWPRNAWFFHAMIEKGITDVFGDFSYTAFTVDIRRYQALPLGLSWDSRARIFSSFDPIPAQISQSINGYGAIRGLGDRPYDFIRGDRLALLSSELRAPLPDAPLVRYVLTNWNLMFFSDIGLLAVAGNQRSPLRFLETGFDEWKKTVGIGVSGESFLPYVGIYVARDLDEDRSHPRMIVRIARSF